MNLPFLSIIDMEEVLGSIGDFVALCFFWAIKGLFDLMDTFMDIIFQLAGLKDLGGTGGNILSNFFSNTGSKGSNSIATLYFSICLVCIVLMFFLTVISIIKQDFFSEEGAKSHAPIFKRLVTGLLYFIAIPPIFIFAVEIVSGLMSALMQIDSFNSLSSLSQTIFELSLTEPQWMKVQGIELAPIPHWSVMEAKDFVALTETYNFNWLIFLGVIGMSFYSLFMIAFGLVKRVFNLVILYILGPIAISQSVIDGGGKMKRWKDSVVKEFVSVFGTIIGLVIFFMFITEVVSDLELFSGNNNFAYFANSIVKAMFILVGFSVIKGGSSYINDAIGGQISINDGASAFSGAMDSVKTAKKAFTAPMKAAGKGLNMAKNAITKPANVLTKGIKGINTGIEAVRENGFGGAVRGAVASRLPTLDAFRTDAQLERIKAERENIKNANQATKNEKDVKEKERLERISNPNSMKEYMNDQSKNPVKTWEDKLATGTDDINQKAYNINTSGQLEQTTGGRSVNHAAVGQFDLQAVDANGNYKDYDKGKYDAAKKAMDKTISDEKSNMTQEIKTIRKQIENSTDQVEIQKLQKEINEITEIHEKRITELTEMKTSIEKREEEHKVIQEVKKAATDLNGISGSNTHAKSDAINAATKVDAALKKGNDTFK